jgi:chaperone modulatory protein CbpM
MIAIDDVVVTIAGLQREDVERLIEQECIRPAGTAGAWLFRDIDVARLRLIQELRQDLALQEEALPVVLRLLDQLYETRRHLRRLRAAVEQAVPPEMHQAVIEALSAGAGEEQDITP